jgi:hypothetical protein
VLLFPLRTERVSLAAELLVFALELFSIELVAFIQKASSSASFTSLVRLFLCTLMAPSGSPSSLSFAELPMSVSLSEEALERPFFRFR